jgi:hypothetical protein
MSLVHEALLKAEREKQRKTGAAPIFTQLAQPTPRPTPTREEKPVAAEGLPRFTGPMPQKPAPAAAAPAQKSHQTVLVVVSMCVALVAIVAIVFMVNRSAMTTQKSESSAGSGSIIPAASPSASTEAGKPRSPTRTLAQPAAPTSPADASQYKITGIMKDSQGNYCAVIDGRVVYVEQYINGAIVKAIERDRVTLDVGGREAVVRLY